MRPGDCTIHIHKPSAVTFREWDLWNDAMALLTKMQSLSIHEPTYSILYSRCQQQLPKPHDAGTSSSPFALVDSCSSVFFHPGAPIVAPTADTPSFPNLRFHIS